MTTWYWKRFFPPLPGQCITMASDEMAAAQGRRLAGQTLLKHL